MLVGLFYFHIIIILVSDPMW